MPARWLSQTSRKNEPRLRRRLRRGRRGRRRQKGGRPSLGAALEARERRLQQADEAVRVPVVDQQQGIHPKLFALQHRQPR